MLMSNKIYSSVLLCNIRHSESYTRDPTILIEILQNYPREAPASSEAVSPASYSCCSVALLHLLLGNPKRQYMLFWDFVRIDIFYICHCIFGYAIVRKKIFLISYIYLCLDSWNKSY